MATGGLTRFAQDALCLACRASRRHGAAAIDDAGPSPTPERAGSTPRRVAVCLAPDMSLSSALLACEPLRSVNRFFGWTVYEIAFVGPSRAPVRSGIGIVVTPSATFAGEEPYDLVIAVSAYDQPEAYKRALARFLRRHARRGIELCGVDFGAVFLAEAGLLDGHRATLHWEVMEAVADRFARVRFCDDVYVVDRGRLTCGGHLACHDLFLWVVERDHGARIAAFVAADVISGPARPSDTRQSNPLSWDPTVRNPHLRDAIDLMEQNVETPLTIPRIAAEIGRSVRQLQNLSRLHLGETLSSRYLDIRLNAARHMLMYGDMAVSEIVAATGFGSSATFSRAFRRRFGTTATAYRRAFVSRLARPSFTGGR